MEQVNDNNTATGKRSGTPWLWLAGAVLLSGICWYLGNDISGDFGLLMWIAPIAVLLVSFRTSGKATFLIALVAYFIGKLSWLSFLVSVITLVPTLLFMLIFSLVFAIIVTVARRFFVKTNAWYSMFAFPVLFTTFEFLLLKFAPDGTAGSIAYSQMNFLPVIQVASITGILGITFLLTLFPASIAAAWQFRKEKMIFRKVVIVAGAIMVAAFAFGMIRLGNSSNEGAIRVGLVVLDEGSHHITDKPDAGQEKLTTENYIKEITVLAGQGAKIVVMPERAINITKETEKDILAMLCETAKHNQVFIISGYTNFRTDTTRNSSLVIDANGNLVTQYNKARLIKVLEDQFKPGNQPGLFNYNGIAAGTAICKDLDFPDYIRELGQTTFTTIPAWDFVVDGWLHSRMAILRGVENGFAEVRAARQGRLTITDCYGRIISEADCANKEKTTLLGDVPLEKRNTLYARFGEWFGILNAIGMILLLTMIIKKSPRTDGN